MLTDRRSALLNLIVEEYVDTALPVGSQYIVRKHDMSVSSATVRLEMARLEEEGYINQPHTSAGRVPSDKGYRYYVESLMTEESLPWEEREMIRHQFHQAERAMEQWFQLAAAVLAHQSATSPSSLRRGARRRGCATCSWCPCRRPAPSVSWSSTRRASASR